MEELSTATSTLKGLLENVVDYKDKEETIFKHIEAAEKLNYVVDDFPSNLDWFNASEPLCGSHLQGKIVVLDFFTYCCINCLHIIPHLRELEENFSVTDGLLVIGVHSAKFDNEKDSQNILLALKRYNISHPVVNDKDCFLWNMLNISCWPTLVILGPQRQPIFVLVGECHRDELLLFVKVALKFYKNSISSHQLPLITCDQIITSRFLSFPGKITRWGDIFAVSDSGNHRIIVFDKNGFIKHKIGGKVNGFKDGSFETARFNRPQGLTFCDSDVLYVADTENHAVRLINLKTLKVTTAVGNGKQGTDFEGGKIGALQEISSPWDVCVVPCSDVNAVAGMGAYPPLPPLVSLAGNSIPSAPLLFQIGDGPPPPPPPPAMITPPPPPPPSLPNVAPPPSPPSSVSTIKSNPPSKVLLIAAAGTHQIWAYFIESGVWWRGKKYEEKVCVAVAGTGKEENRNNRYPMMASFAQPSGLAYSRELKSVFIADSESSSIRRMSLEDGSVSHVVGGARSPHDLFSYGDVDGRGYDAKLQHPLGVSWNSKRNSLFVCDTYNHKIKEVEVSSRTCRNSLAGYDLQLCEPSGCCLNETEDVLYVCDTNNNCIQMITLLDYGVKKLDLREEPQTVVDKPSEDIWVAETCLRKTGGKVSLEVTFSPADIHGKWRLDVDENRIKVSGLSGKVMGSPVEFTFALEPSDADDHFKVLFDLVLCGSETCAFKKTTLQVHVRRRDIADEAVLCKVTKNLLGC